MHDVVIVGSGPTGLMLAGELALSGVEAVLLERRESQDLAGSRGGGVHARTIELLDQRGIVERFLAEADTLRAATFGGVTLDLSGLPTRHPYTLALFQNRIERLLRGWVDELGVAIRQRADVVGVRPDDEGVTIRLASGEVLWTRYVVGADGGRSVVRREAGIDFVGPDATRSGLIAEVRVSEDFSQAGKVDERGVHGLHPIGGGRVRALVTEARLGPATEPTLDDLRRELIAVFGTDFGAHSPTWLSRFTDATRQAAAYRRGRILLAGDAAHVHWPAGGLGIGLGVQDAVNLGWKLGQVVRGVSGDELLDTYHAERHPAGARALKYTMAQSLFQKVDPRQAALGDLLGEVLAVDAAATVITALITGLDVTYEMGCGTGGRHPLLGRRIPDLDMVGADGAFRVYELLHEAAPMLLQFGGPRLDAGSHRVRHVLARCDGRWELPVVGEVAAPRAVLVRPDGYVAWVGDGSAEGLAEALTAWCGAPELRGKPA